MISSWLKASVVTRAPFSKTRASIARAGSVERCSLASSREEGGGRMPFEVPPLPYDYAALEPYIDEQTMRLHHDKHHQAYVDKVNDALEGTEHAGKPIEEIIANLSAIPEDKRG